MRGWLIIAVGLLVLAGCGRGGDGKASDVSTDSRIPPQVGPRFFPPDGWAWGGVQASGEKAVRYGVAAPTGVPRASIIIAADANESAEVYFETAKDLVAQGYTVWVLDPAPSATAQAATIHALIDNMVRPKGGDVVVLAAYGAGAVGALLEAESNTPRIDGLVLWGPRLTEPLGARAMEKAKMGLGGLAAEGEKDWSRPDYDLSGRATLVEAWRTANPDLRPSKRNWGWFAAQAQSADVASNFLRLKGVGVPVLMVAADADARAKAACSALLHCTLQTAAPTAAPLHLAPDAARAPWLKGIVGFVDARIDPQAHGV